MKAIIVTAPTATGKTQLAVQLARAFGYLGELDCEPRRFLALIPDHLALGLDWQADRGDE